MICWGMDSAWSCSRSARSPRASSRQAAPRSPPTPDTYACIILPARSRAGVRGLALKRREGPMADFKLQVNGATRTVSAEPDTPLLYILRNDLELNGPKFGCGLAQCGA